MVIDIISYTDEQFAALSEEQILEVKTAQQKKNKLTKKLVENKEIAKRKLIGNGTFMSPIWELQCAKLDEEYEQEVTMLREALLFYLRFSFRSSVGSEKYPIDYSLSMEERFADVRDYYVNTYPDVNERWKAFRVDGVAMVYLGEYYEPLYDYLLIGVTIPERD